VSERLGAVGKATELSFSDLTTVDLRLFANMQAGRGLAAGIPFLAGSRISLHMDNVFGERVRVRDQAGITPFSFQPAYVDALGRSVRIGFRKRF
jgi:outer membrane receptor protein involved in Fe transport